MNFLAEYSESVFNEAKRNLSTSLKKLNKKNLHALRVSIKKIHAFLELLSYCYSVKTSIDDRLERLFKKVGKIRELQLTIDFLNQQLEVNGDIRKEFLSELNKQLKEKYRKFIFKYKDNGTEIFEEIFRLIKKQLQSNPENDITAYYQMITNRIFFEKKNLTDSKTELHQLRKEIKELRFNLSVSHPDFSPSISIQKLKEWEIQLGSWHDAVVFVSRLNKYIRDLKPDSELYNEFLRLKKFNLDYSSKLLNAFMNDRLN